MYVNDIVIENQTEVDTSLLKRKNIYSVSDDDLEKGISIGVTDKSDSLSQNDVLSEQQIPPKVSNDDLKKEMSMKVKDKSDSLSQFDMLIDQQITPNPSKENDIHNENEPPPSSEVK
jgi:uncharacterized ubiquitin-like protein YukD